MAALEQPAATGTIARAVLRQVQSPTKAKAKGGRWALCFRARLTSSVGSASALVLSGTGLEPRTSTSYQARPDKQRNGAYHVLPVA